jgi:hypothetical protein
MARVSPVGQLWSFHPRVIAATPDPTTMLLVGGKHGKSLKLSGLSCELARLIERGSCEETLLDRLLVAYPGKSMLERRQALNKFLGTLTAAGLLRKGGVDVGEHPHSLRRWSLPNPDPVARILARWILAVPAPVRTVLAGLLLLLSIGVTCVVPGLFQTWQLLLLIDYWEAALVLGGVLLWLALHELAHATVCRMHGCPVSGMGLIFRGFLLPSFYVDTGAVRLIEGQKIRLQVALAGPLIDILCAGLIAGYWWLLSLDGQGGIVVQLLLVIVLLGLYFNLTPFRSSDGLSAFHACFDNTYPTHRVSRRRLKLLYVDVRERAYAAYAALYITITAAGLFSVIDGSIIG